MKAILAMVVTLLVCCGCTSVSVRTPPGVDLTQYQRVFVLQPFNENRHVDEMIVDELRALGKEASSGPLTMMPENTDLLLTYVGRWTGDFTSDLTDLGVEVFIARNRRKVGEGRYYQPSARPKRAEFVVHTLTQRLFTPPARKS